MNEDNLPLTTQTNTVRLVQSSKAPSPISVTLFGMVMLVRFLQQTILNNMDRAMERALDKAIEKRCEDASLSVKKR